MRNIKKLLALMLVMVMALGMIPMVASADNGFTDADDIEYFEAAGLLKELGVIVGYTDGSYQPKQTVTRAEAMAYIVRMLLTPAVANRLPGGSSSFTDVLSNPSAAWASGIIEYAVSQGIALGRGDGIFDPQGAVTGIEMAAFLLRALKIGAYNDPATWAIHAVADGTRLGILTIGDDVDLSASAIRDQVGLYTFNALFAGSETVDLGTEYELVANIDNNTAHNIKGLHGSRFSTRSELVTIATAAGGEYITGAFNLTEDPEKEYAIVEHKLTETKGGLAEDVFKMTSRSASDPFRRPVTEHLIDHRVVYTATDTPLEVYTAAVTENTLYNLLGLTPTSDISISAFRDGTAVAGQMIRRGETSNVGISGNGVLTEVYRNGRTITIVQINTYLAQVVAVHAATATRDRRVDFIIWMGGSVLEGEDTSIDSYETDEFAVDDYLLVNMVRPGDLLDLGLDDIQTVKATTSVEDKTVTAYTNVTDAARATVTFDGRAERYSAQFAPTSVGVATNGYIGAPGATWTFYLDSYGYIITNEQYASGNPLNYVLVNGFEFKAAVVTEPGTFAAPASLQINGYLLDGTKVRPFIATTTMGATAPTGVTYNTTAYATVGNWGGDETIKSGDVAARIGSTWYLLHREAGPTGAQVISGLEVILDQAYSYTVSSANERWTLSNDGVTGVVAGTNLQLHQIADPTTLTVLQNRATVGGANVGGVTAFANPNTTLVAVNATTEAVTAIAGFQRFPTASWSPLSGNVVYLRNGTVITDILVVGSWTDGSLGIGSVDGFARVQNRGQNVWDSVAGTFVQTWNIHHNGVLLSNMKISASSKLSDAEVSAGTIYEIAIVDNESVGLSALPVGYEASQLSRLSQGNRFNYLEIREASVNGFGSTASAALTADTEYFNVGVLGSPPTHSIAAVSDLAANRWVHYVTRTVGSVDTVVAVFIITPPAADAQAVTVTDSTATLTSLASGPNMDGNPSIAGPASDPQAVTFTDGVANLKASGPGTILINSAVEDVKGPAGGTVTTRVYINDQQVTNLTDMTVTLEDGKLNEITIVVTQTNRSDLTRIIRIDLSN